MRVDSQINDKDLRDKKKHFEEYTPLDFGVEEIFCMMPFEKLMSQKTIHYPELTVIHEDTFSINQSGVKNTPSHNRSTVNVGSSATFTQIFGESKVHELNNCTMIQSVDNT